MKKNKRAIVVTNGDIGKPEIIRKHLKYYGFSYKDMVISADGGAKNALKLGLDISIATGDMDSIDPQIMETLKARGIKFIVEQPEKDYTDTHLALREAIKEGAEKVIILAAAGDRLDHTLANLLLLADPYLSGTHISMITETEEIFASAEAMWVKGKVGSRISLFSLTPYTLLAETRGLKYGLKNEKLLFSPIRGISNEFIKNKAYLGIKEGMLLIIKKIEEE